MALSPLQPGQVIRYAYLWWNEARAGRQEGPKDRPCGIVLPRLTKAGRTEVYMLPITPPRPFKCDLDERFRYPDSRLSPHSAHQGIVRSYRYAPVLAPLSHARFQAVLTPAVPVSLWVL